jgi:PBSX family phage portal protein
MTKHVVDVVGEPDEDDVPIVDTVRFLSIEKENVEYDSFSRPATELRTMGGTDAVFKRKVSREINKVRRGQEDAESKQIEEEAEYTGYQMFDVILPPYNMDYLAKLYELSPHHYAAVNAKVANIVGLGYRLVETPFIKRKFEENSGSEAKLKRARAGLEQHREEMNVMLEEFNEEDTFTEVLIKVWRDYEVTGNGYLEIGRKKDGTIGYLGHITTQTMRIRKKRDGFVQISGYKLQFFANFGDNHDRKTGAYKPKRNPIGGGVPNEVIHIKKYSPTNGFYGIPDIIAAKQAIAGNEFAQRFNIDYFENKAIPKHVIVLKGVKLGPNAERNLLSFFETLKGQNHRSIVLPLPADTQTSKYGVDFETIGPDTQDASFMNYRKANLADILMAHRVPISKISVGEGMSLALAKDADKTFKEQVCAPEQKILEKKLNRIMKELTDTLEIKLNEMSLTDADTQSKIDERMVKAGIWLPNEPRVRDGMPAVEGGNERTDLNAKDKIAQAQAEERAVRERNSARSAGATDSAGEARSPKGEGRTVT